MNWQQICEAISYTRYPPEQQVFPSAVRIAWNEIDQVSLLAGGN